MEFKEYFQQPYQGGDSFLQEVVFPIFGEETFEDGFYAPLLDENPELKTIAKTTGIESICRIGTIQVEFNPIDIFDITVTDHIQMTRNRVAIQQLVRRIMNTYSSAFMIFHYEDTKNWDWRFTFCSKKGSNDDTTNSKRYTFLLGPNQSCRTASENFCKLLQKNGEIELKDIEAAFDAEALSKEFFGKYKQHYQRFVDYMCDDENGIRQSFIDTSFDHTEMDAKKIKDREEKPIRDYVKKLLGRIVFLHFLQKKGWMGVPQDKPWGQGDTNFMKHLFEKCTEDQKENFLDEVLEPLFSDALDTDRSSDDFLFDTNVKLDCGSVVKIPYLNGGLFERDYLDEPETRFPVEYFADLLEFFYQYNFTINENDPNDAQVGVDPEMLGRIFENLLEDNKDKGAFYTPKEIVQYMCRQSLIAYLQTDVDNEETKTAIESFVKTYNVELLGGTDSELSKSLDNRLKDVKICDPAIGSGAFPMGVLKELFFCRGAIEKFDDAASIKRHIIQQNIYGVDIERGAVDIARLRFWLSLIVDEETPHSLPNLDYKIMQGNSLLESFMGLDLSTLADDQIKIAKKNRGQVSFIFDEADTKKNILIYLEQYFSESNHSSKSQIRQAIENTVKEHIKICAGYDSKVVTAVDNLTIPNDKFFLWHTYFSDVFNRPLGCNGFDIVIGNPPYKSLTKNNTNKIVLDLYTNNFASLKHGSSKNLFTLFIEFAIIALLKHKGILSYIIPEGLFKTRSYLDCTNLMSSYGTTIQTVTFSNYVFENAVTGSLIFIYTKEINSSRHFFQFEFNSNSEIVESVSKFNEIIAKISKDTIPLKEVATLFKGMVVQDRKNCVFALKENAPNIFLLGKNITQWVIKSEGYTDYSKLVIIGGTKKIEKHNHIPRILIRRTGNTLCCVFLEKEALTESTLYSCWSNNPSQLNDLYLLGLLNSRTINYFNKEMNITNEQGFPQILMTDLQNLPIKIAEIDQQIILANYVRNLIDTKQIDPQADITVQEGMINAFVYQLYNLTDDEIKIIEGE